MAPSTTPPPASRFMLSKRGQSQQMDFAAQTTLQQCDPPIRCRQLPRGATQVPKSSPRRAAPQFQATPRFSSSAKPAFPSPTPGGVASFSRPSQPQSQKCQRQAAPTSARGPTSAAKSVLPSRRAHSHLGSSVSHRGTSTSQRTRGTPSAGRIQDEIFDDNEENEDDAGDEVDMLKGDEREAIPNGPSSTPRSRFRADEGLSWGAHRERKRRRFSIFSEEDAADSADEDMPFEVGLKTGTEVEDVEDIASSPPAKEDSVGLGTRSNKLTSGGEFYDTNDVVEDMSDMAGLESDVYDEAEYLACEIMDSDDFISSFPRPASSGRAELYIEDDNDRLERQPERWAPCNSRVNQGRNQHVEEIFQCHSDHEGEDVDVPEVDHVEGFEPGGSQGDAKEPMTEEERGSDDSLPSSPPFASSDELDDFNRKRHGLSSCRTRPSESGSQRDLHNPHGSYAAPRFKISAGHINTTQNMASKLLKPGTGPADCFDHQDQSSAAIPHDIFSPQAQRGAARYDVPGGLAAELRGWLVKVKGGDGGNSGVNPVESLISNPATAVEVAEVLGGGAGWTLVQGQRQRDDGEETTKTKEASDGEKEGGDEKKKEWAKSQESPRDQPVQMILAGQGRIMGLSKPAKMERGSVVSVAPPMWAIELGARGGGRWVVACDWRVCGGKRGGTS